MITLPSFECQEITPKKADGSRDINSPVQPLNWAETAEKYFIIQDNQSLPIIFNGSIAVRANQAKKQLPVGNVMCYSNGRLAVALPDRFSFRIGDLVFGQSGTAANQYRDAELYFTENDFLNEGGDLTTRVFGAPSNFGPITSMNTAAMTDTQLGQGPLMIGQYYMVFTVNLPFDRTTWKDMAQALKTTTPILGPLGQDSTISINTDLWYRSIDGIRSYIMAQRQMNTGWSMTPMSAEIDEILSLDTPELLEFGSAVVFNNRLLMTCSPVKSKYGVYHRGLVALDFNLVSTIRNKSAPAWEGVWSGVKILKILKIMVNMRERCFMYVLNDNNAIELWEIMPNDKLDNGTERIRWSLEMPSYDFGDGDQFKRLETARIVVTNMVGQFDGVVTYRSDEAPCYQPWDVFSKCGLAEDCGPPDCIGPHTYREQVRVPIKLHMPPDYFDPISGRKYRTGYEFQPRIDLTGYGEIRRITLYAKDERESLSPERNAP